LFIMSADVKRKGVLFMKKRNIVLLSIIGGIVVLVGIVSMLDMDSDTSNTVSVPYIEIAGHKFVIGENKYNADLEYIVYDMGLSAEKVKEPGNGIVNSIFTGRQNERIVLQYLDEKINGPNSRVRVLELYYSNQNGENLLAAIKMFEFDDDAMQHGNIADRALPVGNNLKFPAIKKESRKETRFRSYVEPQKASDSNFAFEYIWTSNLEGVSYLLFSKK